MNRPIRSLLLTGVFTTSACVIGADDYPTPEELPQSSIVDRTRVLAIRLDPPEARPGEFVTATSLLPDPEERADVKIWLACAPSIASSFGCLGEGAMPIGIEPGQFPPTLAIPDDALEGIPDDEIAEGIYWTIQVLALPQEIAEQEEPDFEALDFNEIEAAFKRLVVSNASTPNTNPDIVRFLVDGVQILPNSVLQVDAEQSYAISIELHEDAIQTYEFVNSDGESETRVEEPYISWYASDGDWYSSTSLYPFVGTDWLAPTQDGRNGTIWAVVRDRRGGIAWIDLPYEIRP